MEIFHSCFVYRYLLTSIHVSIYVLFCLYSIDEGPDPIQLTNIQCRPTDDLIIQCPSGPDILCSHAEDVVVQCCK